MATRSPRCLRRRQLDQLVLRRGAADGGIEAQLPGQALRARRAVAGQQAQSVALRAQRGHRFGRTGAQCLVEARSWRSRRPRRTTTPVRRHRQALAVPAPTQSRRAQAPEHALCDRAPPGPGRVVPRPATRPRSPAAWRPRPAPATADGATTGPARPPPPAPHRAWPASGWPVAPAACCRLSACVVSVPVLSMNRWSSRAMLSSASSRCSSTPRRARPPAAATSAAGAASDSAHGQVTISTDTATQTARDGSITLHTAAAPPASSQHHPQEGPGQAVGHARHRRALAHRLAHQRDDGLVARVGADALHPHQHRRAQVDAAGHHRVARLLGHRRRFAGEQRLVDLRVAVEQAAVGRERPGPAPRAHGRPAPGAVR